ncbi:XRE family transcriptional regulator [Streptomyces sp. KO7888]|nr:XRE family transcriptional regulator [Streptomyces sp. KO7888]
MDEQPYNPSLDPALKIADFFGLPVEALFSLGPLRPRTDEMYGRRTP